MACFRTFERRLPTIVPVPETDIAVLLTWDGHAGLISAEDIPLVQGRSWGLDVKGYITCVRGGGRLHSQIMCPPRGLVVDHIDRDKLNNQRSNLRVVPQRINSRNHGLAVTNTSGATGVFVQHDRNRDRYVAYITSDRKRNLGTFDTFEQALAARKAAEIELWGDAR